jgi:hypothetical protein
MQRAWRSRRPSRHQPGSLHTALDCGQHTEQIKLNMLVLENEILFAAIKLPLPFAAG